MCSFGGAVLLLMPKQSCSRITLPNVSTFSSTHLRVQRIKVPTRWHEQYNADGRAPNPANVALDIV
jgi:hypothetical protein